MGLDHEPECAREVLRSPTELVRVVERIAYHATVLVIKIARSLECFMIPDRIGDMGAATLVHTQRFKDLLCLDAAAYRVVLLPALDVMKKARDDRSGKERFDHGLADATSVALDEDNRPGIPCYCLAVTEPVRALQLRFVQIRAASSDELMSFEHLLGEAEERGVLSVESGAWKGLGYFERRILKLLVYRLRHGPIINAEEDDCQDEFSGVLSSD